MNQASSYDPFGFSAAFEIDDSASSRAAPPLDPHHATTGASTPKPVSGEKSLEVHQSIVSPGTEGESDHFVTPPTTATPTRSLTSSPALVKPDGIGATQLTTPDN
ncbi:hypothetical protein C0992_001281, partial [Termitomyces sp. T32_za158]